MVVKFQKTRDPVNVAAEAAAAEHAAAGYPHFEPDIAMDAEELANAALLAKKQKLSSEEDDQ